MSYFSIEAHAEVRQLIEPRDVTSLTQLFTTEAERYGWQSGEDLTLYQDVSVHWGVWVADVLIGGLRLTLETSLGLPYERVWPDYAHLKTEKSADISLLAFKPHQRKMSAIFWLCCIEMIRYCQQTDTKWLFAEVPPSRLGSYRAMGWPFEEVGPLRNHWGEPCHLVRMKPVDAISGLYALPKTRSRRAIEQLERTRDPLAPP